MSSPAPVDARRIEVDPARIARWVAGFGERHGTPDWTAGAGTLTLVAPDGAQAVLEPWLPVRPCPAGEVAALTAWADPPRVLGLVLVRRGGYAVGLAEGERLVAHKAGTRYVQARTAAGGWSQQRYARRRGNQADALATTVADHALRLVLPGDPRALVVGGDRALVRDVLADPRLAPLAGLPRRELPDLPDPRLAVLEQALRRGRAVRVLVSDGA